MSTFFHFRKENTGFFGYLKDVYLFWMSLMVLIGFSMILEGGSDFWISAYMTFFYFGLGGLYWTPLIQRRLDFDNRWLNYFFFGSQFGVPFIGNFVLLVLVVYRTLQGREVEKLEEQVKEEPLEENQVSVTESKEETGKNVRKEDFEGLIGYPKDGLLYQTSWKRVLALIFTFGLWSLKTERWSEEEVDELVKNIESTFEEENLQDKIYYLCSSSEENLIAVLDEEKLRLFRISPKNKKIIKHETVEFRSVKDKENHSSYEIFNRSKGELIVKLHFQLSDDREEFTDDLKSELNNQELYRYRNIWDTEENIKEMKRADIGIKNNFQNFTPYEFEEFVADLFRHMGYNARVTSKSGDFGVDVIAENTQERLAIQVKRHKYTNKVGAPTVQKTLGSIHKADADTTMIVTTSQFTGPAFEQARDAPITLWDREVLHDQVEKQFIELN